jgi:hypothetical protein
MNDRKDESSMVAEGGQEAVMRELQTNTNAQARRQDGWEAEADLKGDRGRIETVWLGAEEEWKDGKDAEA